MHKIKTRFEGLLSLKEICMCVNLLKILTWSIGHIRFHGDEARNYKKPLMKGEETVSYCCDYIFDLL